MAKTFSRMHTVSLSTFIGLNVHLEFNEPTLLNEAVFSIFAFTEQFPL